MAGCGGRVLPATQQGLGRADCMERALPLPACRRTYTPARPPPLHLQCMLCCLHVSTMIWLPQLLSPLACVTHASSVINFKLKTPAAQSTTHHAQSAVLPPKSDAGEAASWVCMPTSAPAADLPDSFLHSGSCHQGAYGQRWCSQCCVHTCGNRGKRHHKPRCGRTLLIASEPGDVPQPRWVSSSPGQSGSRSGMNAVVMHARYGTVSNPFSWWPRQAPQVGGAVCMCLRA
jgi:hypothetical protein